MFPTLKMPWKGNSPRYISGKEVKRVKIPGPQTQGLGLKKVFKVWGNKVWTPQKGNIKAPLGKKKRRLEARKYAILRTFGVKKRILPLRPSYHWEFPGISRNA